MTSLQPHLATLLSSLPSRPIEQENLKGLVRETLVKAGHVGGNTTEPAAKGPVTDIRKSQWEWALRNDIFNLATTEGQALKDPNTKFYDEICERLDVILAFTDLDATDQTFPFQILQDLFESLTIPSCSHIFTYLESRSSQLTTNMVPQKGKALVLLRTLNDLLRRLSKTGERTILCGRILNFLSGVFPLGERSGVNLRGEYGPVWEGVKDPRELEEGSKGGDEEMKDSTTDANAMDVDSPTTKKKAPDPKADFYNTFWSLQLPFSKPAVFANPETFLQFKDGVNKVLPVIKEATAKDRAMMGSRSGSASSASNGTNTTNAPKGPNTGTKRKREGSASREATAERESEESNLADYFFAKFLTSPDLLELEIADTHFRRQLLLQLLILLTQLLSFTPTAKAAWSTPRNRSLQMDFTLTDTELPWVKETITKVMDEMRATTPNGRIFAEMVANVMEREKNWVKWKANLCVGFDKEPAYVEVESPPGSGVKRKVGLMEATREERKKMKEGHKEEWQYRLGTKALTSIWDEGCQGLEDLQLPFRAGEVKTFLHKIGMEDKQINIRRAQLEAIAQNRAKAQARAKVEAEKAKAAATNISTEVPKITVQAPSEGAPAPSTAPASTGDKGPAQPTPLHPSLPIKPGTSPLGTTATTPVVSPPPGASPSPAPAVQVQAAQRPSTPAAARTGTPTPSPATAPVLPKDQLIEAYEENKSRLAWLALRAARDRYLLHFGKIGTGDIGALQREIDKEREEEQKRREREEKGEAEPEGQEGVGAQETAGVQVEKVDGEKEAEKEEKAGEKEEQAEQDVNMKVENEEEKVEERLEENVEEQVGSDDTMKVEEEKVEDVADTKPAAVQDSQETLKDESQPTSVSLDVSMAASVTETEAAPVKGPDAEGDIAMDE